MNLQELKFIPQSNVRDNSTISLDDLIEVEPEIIHILKREGRLFKFKANSIEKNKDFGYTAAIDNENNVFFIKSHVDSPKPYQPQFLKGDSSTLSFTSDYLALLLDTVYPNEEYFNLEIVDDNIWKIVVATTNTKNVNIDSLSINIETPTSFSVEIKNDFKSDEFLLEDLLN